MPMESTNVGTPRQDLVGAYHEFDPAQQGFVADLLFPRFGVEEMSGTFGRVPIEAFTRDYGDKVNRRANAERSSSDWEYADDSWLLKEWSHESPVDRTQRRRLQKYFRSNELAVMRCRQVIEIRKERALAAVFEDTTAYPLSGTTGHNATVEWDNAATATPVDDFEKAIEAKRRVVGNAPLTGRITRKQHKALSQCDQILEKLKYVRALDAVLPLDELADALDLAEIIVCNGVYNAATPGVGKSLQDIWNNEYASVFVKGSGEDLEAGPQFGRTFELDDMSGVKVHSYEWGPKNQERFYTEEHLQQKVVHAEAHYLIGNCITI